MTINEIIVFFMRTPIINFLGKNAIKLTFFAATKTVFKTTLTTLLHTTVTLTNHMLW